MIGYPRSQGGAILPVREGLFCSRNNVSPKFKRVHDSFISQIIFRDTTTFACYWLPFSARK